MSANHNNKKLPVAFALALTALALNQPAIAGEVFRWVDSEGVVHFSQWAPDDVEDVSKLVVKATNPPDYDPADDPYSISRQAERTSEAWKEIETRRDELREKRLEAEKRERQESERYDYEPYPYYSPYYSYRPRPPGFRPRPPHVRPPIYPPNRPILPIMPTSEWTDPMRSAHIGVRRR
jgi:hypothetical protein